MAEYIDRDALLAEAKRISGPMTGDGWDNLGVYALINRQPAADVIERKKGMWETSYLVKAFGVEPTVWYCSECHQITKFRTFFCPNCFADMRGEDNG